MRFNIHRGILCIAVAIALAGCARSVDIAHQSTKGNLGVEDAHNQVLLLNTLRAYKHRPMYFTGISSLAGPLGSISPSTTVTVPFGSVIANNSAATTFGVDTNKFTVNVLDGQKFVTGIITPLKSSLLKYYLDQGWPSGLILSLTIRQIDYDPPVEIQDEKGNKRTISTLLNYPGDKDQFDDFQKEIAAMIACGISFGAAPADPPKPIGPAFSSDNLSRLRDRVDAAKEKLALISAGEGKWNLIRPSEGASGIKLKDLSAGCKSLAATPMTKDGKPVAPAPLIALLGSEVRDQPPPSDAEKRALADKGSRTINIFVRSPEAILYYMGEIIRACLDGDIRGRKYCAETVVADHNEKIFNVERTDDETSVLSYFFGPPPRKRTFLSVSYDGYTYSLTSGPRDRSFHSLSLVSQLIGLQKEASELPQSTPLRVITQ